MAHRNQQLEDSLKLHQFRHDMEDEVGWIRERTPLATNPILGHTLTEVQNLLKKHQVWGWYIDRAIVLEDSQLYRIVPNFRAA